jgi:hypothetical protein
MDMILFQVNDELDHQFATTDRLSELTLLKKLSFNNGGSVTTFQ